MSKQHSQTGKVSMTDHNTVLLYSILGVYFLLISWGISNHEQWRDEAQAWLIVRDSGFAELFSILRTEGHPPLWYLLIMPFVKAGAPYVFQNFLGAAIMLGAVYIMLFRTNLPLLIKILLPFSFFFLYEYTFFARSYCLIAFFTICVISLYPRRFEKPWLYALCVVGLFNTHVLVFTLCGTLVLLYIWDLYSMKINSIHATAAAVLMVIGGGYLLPYLFLAKMSDEFAKGIDDNWNRIATAVNNGVVVGLSELLAALLLLLAIVLQARDRKALILLAGGLISVLYILGFKYFAAGMRHQGVIFFVLLVSIGIASVKDAPQVKHTVLKMLPVQWVFVAILFLQLKPSFEHYMTDIGNSFSGAKDAAAYLEDNKLDNRIIIGHQAWAASAILPFLGKDAKMYYGECGRYGTYYVYDSCFIQDKWRYPVEHSVDKAYDNFKGKLDSVVLVFNYPANQQAMRFLDLIYSTPEPPIVQDEAFYIYRFKGGVK